MAHVRKQIRDAVKAVLGALPTYGTRVFASRVYPLKEVDLPCLLVNTDDEDMQSDSTGTLLLERSLTLTVRAVAMVNDALDDTLDAMLAEVETAMSGSVLGGLVKQVMPTSIRVQMEDGLQKPVGVATLSFTVTYFTTGSDPATAL